MIKFSAAAFLLMSVLAGCSSLYTHDPATGSCVKTVYFGLFPGDRVELYRKTLIEPDPSRSSEEYPVIEEVLP